MVPYSITPHWSRPLKSYLPWTPQCLQVGCCLSMQCTPGINSSAKHLCDSGPAVISPQVGENPPRVDGHGWGKQILDPAPENYIENEEKLNSMFTDLKIQKLPVFRAARGSAWPDVAFFPGRTPHSKWNHLLHCCLSQAHLPEGAHVIWWQILPICQYTCPKFNSQLLEELLANKEVAVNAKCESILTFSECLFCVRSCAKTYHILFH